MLLNRYKILIIIGLFAFASPSLFSQSEGFLDSETIRQKFPEVLEAEQQIQTIVSKWKLEIESMKEQINKLETEIKKNRLIWSDEESSQSEADLESMKNKKAEFSTDKFIPGGEFDIKVKQIMQPFESKINDWLQNDSYEEEIDMLKRDE